MVQWWCSSSSDSGSFCYIGGSSIRQVRQVIVVVIAIQLTANLYLSAFRTSYQPISSVGCMSC